MQRSGVTLMNAQVDFEIARSLIAFYKYYAVCFGIISKDKQLR